MVDGSDLDECKRHFLLRASVPVNGRSLTLYEEVHTLKSKEKPKTPQHFLPTLKSLLPPSGRPILLTDAGLYPVVQAGPSVGVGLGRAHPPSPRGATAGRGGLGAW